MTRAGLLALLLPLAAAAQAPDFSRLVREQAPAVVSISVVYATPPVLPDVPHDEPVPGLFERFTEGFMPDFDLPPLGSGFIVAADGWIVTSHHIVEEAFDRQVIVRLSDGREIAGRVAGSDRASDIALVKVSATGLPQVRVGDPARLQPGQWVVTIGTPFGFDYTVAAGIVSTARRTLPWETHFPFIQTDAAINPGHSGGPLFNLEGEVVGVNSRMFSPVGGSVGLSFAVPIDVALRVADQLRRGGAIARGRIGLKAQEVSPDLARAFRLGRAEGALVTEVERGSEAERAGLRAGDVVTAFGGQPVRSNAVLMAQIAETAPGTEAVVEYLREGRARRAGVRVGAPERALDGGPEAAPGDPLGLHVAPLSEVYRRKLGLDSGVVVQRVSGAARRAGLRARDIVLSANGRAVRAPEELAAELASAAPGSAVALLVDRMGNRAFLPLRIP